jgi:hypothetical protein
MRCFRFLNDGRLTISELDLLPADSTPAKIAEMLRRHASDAEIHHTPHVSFPMIAKVTGAIHKNAPPPSVKIPGRPSKVSPVVLRIARAQTMANRWLSGKRLCHANAEEISVPISRQTVNRVR